MNLSPINLHNATTQISAKQRNKKYSNLSPLAYDTISFGAMKKKEFDGIDLAVIQKFSAPIEKFNSNEDLQNWADEKLKEIVNKDFGGRSEETKIQRKAMLKEWSNYVLDENDAYKKTTAFLILSAITKDLREDNDNIPPVLNKGVLADCISEIEKNIKINPKYQFDLNKMYKNKLRSFYMDDIETNTGETATKWVVIPSKEHDFENFEANVEKLKALSYKTWCTKSFNAEPYLEKGDFHIYLENGNPKLGVRFAGDEIEEIQGERNNGKIPLDYLNTLKRHVSENNLQLGQTATGEIVFAQKAKIEIEKVKNELSEAIRNNDAKTIYRYFGIKVQEGKDGYLTISEYMQPSEYYTFKDLGIDENKLFEKVKVIEGKADFGDSQITNLTNLETIGCEADFTDSKITDLGSLKSIGGYVDFYNTKITNLGKLKSIGGNADFRYSQVTDLKNLEFVGGNAYFRDSQITDLGCLESIGGYADFGKTKVTDLGSLKSIGGDADFRNSQITDLANLKSIGGNADFRDSQITDLSSLKSIGENADFRNSQVANLGNLESIGGYADFRETKVADLGSLKSIGGDADFGNSQITDLSSLKSIGGYADFGKTKVTDLRSLKSIGGDADFSYSQITDLANLESIGGYVDFRKIKVTDLRNLKTIGGDADFSYSQITDLRNLESIAGSAMFGFSQITDLGSLETIGGDASFGFSEVSDLGSLKFIGGDTEFAYSKITDLQNLETIGGNADFRCSQVANIGSLKSVGEEVYIKDSPLVVEDFNNIEVQTINA